MEEERLRRDGIDRKKFSHRRSNFPSLLCPRFAQRVRKPNPQQLVAVRMRLPNSLCPQVTGSLGQARSGDQRSAGDFEQNQRGERQRSTHGNQSSPSRNVQCGREFQQILAIFVGGADKHRNRQRQPWPLTTFILRRFFALNHLSHNVSRTPHRTLGAKSSRECCGFHR